MPRLFTALEIPRDAALSLSLLRGGLPGARWVDVENYHITLRFIGEVDRPMAEDVALALSSIRCPPLQAALHGVGQFDSRGRVHALWAGVRPHAPLAGLHKKVDQALVRCGLAPERRAYLPHITLARMNTSVAAPAGFLEAHAGLASAAFALDHFLLFESHLGHEAAAAFADARYPMHG